MVYSYNTNEQNLNTNSIIVFTTDEVMTGCTVTHTEGTGMFVLSKPGYYYVTVTGDFAATAEETDPISIQLYNGANTLTAATASELSTSDTDIVNLTINAIIKVEPSCCIVNNNVRLNVVNTGVAATAFNTTITITKIA